MGVAQGRGETCAQSRVQHLILRPQLRNRRDNHQESIRSPFMSRFFIFILHSLETRWVCGSTIKVPQMGLHANIYWFHFSGTTHGLAREHFVGPLGYHKLCIRKHFVRPFSGHHKPVILTSFCESIFWTLQYRFARNNFVGPLCRHYIGLLEYVLGTIAWLTTCI